jgi:hypothetical protein
MTTQLIILPNGRAKEIHPMGDMPTFNYQFPPDGPSDSMLASAEADYEKVMEIWLEVHSSLKEYRITNPKILLSNPPKPSYKVGQVVTCEVNQEEGTCIVV